MIRNALAFLIIFFKHKNIKLVTFFVCWNTSDVIHFQKSLSTHEMRTLYINPYNYLFSNSSSHFQFERFNNNYGCVLDFSCDYSVDFLQTISDENKFQPAYKWLILCPESRKEMAKNLLKSLHVRLDSDITLALFDEEMRTQFILYDLYNPGFNLGGQIRTNYLGIWRKNLNATSLRTSSNISTYVERINMSDVRLRTATGVTENLTTPLEEYLRRREVVNHDAMSKIFHALFAHLKDIHNFSYTLTYTNAWFGSSKGGNDGGLLKELTEDSIDIATTGATMTKERVDYVDYSVDVFRFRTCFIFRDEGVFKNIFIDAFPVNTWLALFAMAVIISLCVKYTYSSGRSRKCNFIRACMITIGGLCLQGSVYHPGSAKSKCVLLSLSLMSALVYSYYSTIIVSKLLNSSPRSITTLKALVDSDLELGAEDIIYLCQIFLVRNNSDVQKLQRKLRAQSEESPSKLSFFGIEEGIRRVQNERFAYHSEAEKVYPVVAKTFRPSEICDLSEICMYNASAYFMWKKKSEYKKLFSVSYRRMIEHGLLYRQRAIWQAKKPSCTSKGNFVNVGLERVSLAFFIIAAGIGLSSILLLFEIMCHRFGKHFKRCYWKLKRKWM